MKQKLRTVLPALLAAVFLFSVGMMLRQQLEYQKIAADSEEAARIAGLPVLDNAPPAPSGSRDVTPDKPEEPAEPPDPVSALAAVDLDALRAVNRDVAGWIAIPGTELSYPLVQGRDNQFYLSRSWKKEPSAGGSVFLERTNSRDLTDFHTIVYAHRMRNDTMFGTLKYYKDPDFWREHPRVYVATEDGVYVYDIFAAHKVSVKGIIYRLDLEESHLEEEFLQACVNGSVLDTGIVPESGDRILTLSTCTGNGHADRWVVQAVLRSIEAAE